MVERALLPQRLDTEAIGSQDKIADRIFLLDYTRAIEIGAYAEEVGVTQRLRFDIVLEVTRNTAHIDDQVGRVINYDDLVEAIESIARGPRITLLETFAERLAQTVLIDPRARRVHIRIEKLDRLPNGARLGVEISRVRTPETNEKIWALATEVK
ncbi:MAG: dihydroneopterin aldolase [Thermohalobaculum sp.]|nr:dihydroneopterin aldolase [Thermohalobaculum sp.]